MEIWKAINNYEDSYMVSNQGRVKSLDRYVYKGNNAKGLIKGRVLIGCNYGKGYKGVGLCKNGKVKLCAVHRLVAEHFIENKENHKEVNHIDFDRENNHYENLEWINRSGNIWHSIENMRKSHKWHEMKYIQKRKNGYRLTIQTTKNKVTTAVYDKSFKSLDEAKIEREEILNGKYSLFQSKLN